MVSTTFSTKVNRLQDKKVPCSASISLSKNTSCCPHTPATKISWVVPKHRDALLHIFTFSQRFSLCLDCPTHFFQANIHLFLNCASFTYLSYWLALLHLEKFSYHKSCLNKDSLSWPSLQIKFLPVIKALTWDKFSKWNEKRNHWVWNLLCVWDIMYFWGLFSFFLRGEPPLTLY